MFLGEEFYSSTSVLLEVLLNLAVGFEGISVFPRPQQQAQNLATSSTRDLVESMGAAVKTALACSGSSRTTTSMKRAEKY
jgi:hypothetical protein